MNQVYAKRAPSFVVYSGNLSSDFIRYKRRSVSEMLSAVAKMDVRKVVYGALACATILIVIITGIRTNLTDGTGQLAFSLVMFFGLVTLALTMIIYYASGKLPTRKKSGQET